MRWSAEKIKSLAGTPQQPNPAKPGLHIPIRVTFDEVQDEDIEAQETEDKQIVPRRIKISKKILDTHGYTDGCEGCRHQRAGLIPRNHNEACRKRIVEELEKTAD
eukprot:9153977-Karenia_brevis.AAC.1